MTGVWTLAATWLGLALIAALLSAWLRVSTALSEIIIGTVAQLIIGAAIGAGALGTDESWVKFLSGAGAIILTFLAGAELDPVVFKLKWKEAVAVGVASFLGPFLGCAAAAYRSEEHTSELQSLRHLVCRLLLEKKKNTV